MSPASGLSRPKVGPDGVERTIRFSQKFEADFASLLDSYSVAWDYEPIEFVLERHEDGTIAEGFRPDFYLIDFDCYIELTTLKCARPKRVKLKKMAVLYPDVKVRVLYRQDAVALARRFGFAADVAA